MTQESRTKSQSGQAQDLCPNQSIRPRSATVNEKNHLVIGGIDAVELTAQFGSPLWVFCEETIRLAAEAVKAGLKDYPRALPCYAGKAFLCLAMVRLVEKLGLGLDVVSEGELQTALEAGFPAEKIFLHGNNKSPSELALALEAGVKIVVDSRKELEYIHNLAREKKSNVSILFRIIPGIDLDTHDHIKTGHDTSKFGVPLSQLDELVAFTLQDKHINLLGLHAHIGSQAMEIEPYLGEIELFADLYQGIFNRFNLSLPHLDLGGGIGIAYTKDDNPVSLNEWSRELSEGVKKAFAARNLTLPELSLEPGRAIVGNAGVTLYTSGFTKELDAVNFLPVDGGMADNPRPITYQAKYTAAVANRMEGRAAHKRTWSIVGRFCESGDIIVDEAELDAESGDLIAIFATGAYSYSQSSNYNRTGRPACVLVKNGRAEVILERETCTDLLRHDRIPSWLKD